MEHNCTQEARIAEIQTDTRRLVKIIDGNGREGLAVTVPILSGKIDTLIEEIGELRTVVSGLARFEATTTEVDKYRKESVMSSRQKAGLIMTGIIGASAIITSIILKLL